jgi:hypothetical protein
MNKLQPAQWQELKTLIDALALVLPEFFAKSAAPIFERLDALEQASKQTLADSFRGTWQPGNSYARGSLCLWDGSLWLSMGDTAVKPGSGDDWRLVTKRGRDGKDLRP